MSPARTPTCAWAPPQARQQPATPSHTPGGVVHPGAGGTWTSRGSKERGESVSPPPPSGGCRAPVMLLALLAGARAEWAPLCRSRSSARWREPDTREEEEKEEGGRKGRAPLERGQRPRHRLLLALQRPGSAGAGEPNPGVLQHQPGWDLLSVFPRLCLFFPGCVKSQELQKCRAER